MQDKRRDSVAGETIPQPGEWLRRQLASPLQAVAYFPVAPTEAANANLVMGLFVAQNDGSVQHLAWYINDPAARQPQAASQLIQAIAKTIAPGKRALDTNGGEHVLFARRLGFSFRSGHPFSVVPCEDRLTRIFFSAPPTNRPYKL